VYGQSVTFTATVSSGSGTPTGTVAFRDGADLLAFVNLNAGTASFPIQSFNAGAHQIFARYVGNASFAPSLDSLIQTVNPASTTTALVVDINPSSLAQTVTFTATVAPNPPGAGTPTGRVTFLDGSTALGADFLIGQSPDIVPFTTNALDAGAHSITAVYNGDSNFTGSSTSSALTQTVTGATVGSADIGVTVTHSPSNPNAVVAMGAPLVYTITVTNHDTVTTAHVALNLATVGAPTEFDGLTQTIGAACTPGHGAVECDLAALAPGLSETVTIALRALFSDVRTLTGIAAISTNTVDSGAFPHYVPDTLNVRPIPRGFR
jgi:hypothetical protein